MGQNIHGGRLQGSLLLDKFNATIATFQYGYTNTVQVLKEFLCQAVKELFSVLFGLDTQYEDP